MGSTSAQHGPRGKTADPVDGERSVRGTFIVQIERKLSVGVGGGSPIVIQMLPEQAPCLVPKSLQVSFRVELRGSARTQTIGTPHIYAKFEI